MNNDLELNRLGLTIQQPWAELILRGVKTLEVRSVCTPPKSVYLYTSRKLSSIKDARIACEQHGIELEALACGMVVGKVDIIGSRLARVEDLAATCLTDRELLSDQYVWELAKPERLKSPVAATYKPYGMWFYPFQRKNTPG